MRELYNKKCGSKGRIFYALKRGRNKKRVTAVTHYLVNLKSNTMKNTHANIEIIYEPCKLFLRKAHSFNSY